jgi:16S rRNA (cytosine1402-N4)-methyltransferase
MFWVTSISATEMSDYHLPVLLHESVDGLQIKSDGVYVDCTFGGGGHSRLILEKLGPKGVLVAFDKDPRARLNLPDDPRILFAASDFRYLRNYLKFFKIDQVDGILADLGVSSHQFDTAERGFSLRFSGPLDMRMDTSSGITAAEVLNTYEQDRLADVLYRYGEIPASRKIAAALVNSRPLDDTASLRHALAPFYRKNDEHKFLAKVFQALRIEVNDELAALEELLASVPGLLTPGGRLSVISYHSLEDRLVKHFIRAGNFTGIPEKDFFGKPILALKAVNRQVIVPSATEIENNNRARSAKLRIAEKIA